MTIATVLLVLALVCFVLATFGANVPRVNLVALGLSLWVLAVLLGGAVVLRT